MAGIGLPRTYTNGSFRVQEVGEGGGKGEEDEGEEEVNK